MASFGNNCIVWYSIILPLDLYGKKSSVLLNESLYFCAYNPMNVYSLQIVKMNEKQTPRRRREIHTQEMK